MATQGPVVVPGVRGLQLARGPLVQRPPFGSLQGRQQDHPGLRPWGPPPRGRRGSPGRAASSHGGALHDPSSPLLRAALQFCIIGHKATSCATQNITPILQRGSYGQRIKERFAKPPPRAPGRPAGDSTSRHHSAACALGSEAQGRDRAVLLARGAPGSVVRGCGPGAPPGRTSCSRNCASRHAARRSSWPLTAHQRPQPGRPARPVRWGDEPHGGRLRSAAPPRYAARRGPGAGAARS